MKIARKQGVRLNIKPENFIKLKITEFAKLNSRTIPVEISAKKKNESIGKRIRYEAVTDAKKLHIIHSLNEWKIYPEESETSLFNTKTRKRAIDYVEYLLEKRNYKALVVHSTDGQVLEYIIKKDDPRFTKTAIITKIV
jgi:hypothetical protein